MDWFHCNKCFTQKGSRFAVSSCGHICCEGCVTSKRCSVCCASCSYLAITDEMKPQEKVYFKDPMKLVQLRLEHIAQACLRSLQLIARFQRKQMELIVAHYKRGFSEHERQLKHVTELEDRKVNQLKRENAELRQQLLELKRENAELRKPLSKIRVSHGSFKTNGSQRTSLPVAVTSPVTPHLSSISSLGPAESQGWARVPGPRLTSFTTAGPATSVSSPRSLQQHGHRFLL